jgi:hypothetical protein
LNFGPTAATIHGKAEVLTVVVRAVGFDNCDPGFRLAGGAFVDVVPTRNIIGVRRGRSDRWRNLR